ncbi:MAG: hypothetical protein FJX52_01120 [Alphaproteobacteria bacterium]|nr:hypothetical protein [Alphaproteobacteria bacterium]
MCAAKLLFRIGNEFRWQFRSTHALAAFYRSIVLDPSQFGAYRSLAALLRNSGRRLESIGPYRCAAHLRGDNIDALLGLGTVLRARFRTVSKMASAARQKSSSRDGPSKFFTAMPDLARGRKANATPALRV